MSDAHHLDYLIEDTLWRGKLAKAWGLGGLFKPPSVELKALAKCVCNVSLQNWDVSHGYLDANKKKWKTT